MQEEAIMIEQKMNLPVPTRTDRTAPQNDDVGQAIAAIIAITRREWMSPEPGSPANDETVSNRARSAHPLIRFALDAKRRSSWRARIGRQGWIQSVVQFAELDRTPRGTR
jgi:hypothetical protein